MRGRRGNGERARRRPTEAPIDRRDVVGVSIYSTRAAAPRLRLQQYADYFAASGIRLRLWSLLSDSDSERWLAGSAARRLWLTVHRPQRFMQLRRLVRECDMVIVQREVAPIGVAWIEKLILRGQAFVWDVDDAVWEKAPTLSGRGRWGLRRRPSKYQWLCTAAIEVWAGTEDLSSWCKSRNRRVRVIPTVVAVPDELPPRASGVLVGWIGSPSASAFLEDVLPAVRNAHPVPTVFAVGIRPMTRDHLIVRPWSPEVENDFLRRVSIGLYPVDRGHPLAAGKCGLKAILYMAHGIPLVLTPTRPNAEIVRDGIDGLYADTGAQWTTAVEQLLNDQELCERLRQAAYARAREFFSLQVWGPRVASFLTEVIGEKRGESDFPAPRRA